VGETWEYAFHDKPRSRRELQSMLTAEGKKGWEFAGVVDYDSGPVLVLKKGSRPIFGGAVGGMMGGGFGGPGLGGVAGPGAFGAAGGGARAVTADDIFDRYAEMSGSKDVIDFDKIPEPVKDRLNRTAERLNLPKYPEKGTMTRKEFADRYAKEVEARNRPRNEGGTAAAGVFGTTGSSSSGAAGGPGAATSGTFGTGGRFGAGQANVNTITLKNASARELAGLLEQVMGNRATFAADNRTDTIVVTANDDAMKTIQMLVDKLDAPASPRK
jgi:hypothetical protein